MKPKQKYALAVAFLCVCAAGLYFSTRGLDAPSMTPALSNTHKVTDMAGREVEVRNDVKRVVVIEWEGLVSKSIKAFGLADRIVGIDDYAKKNTFRNFVIPEINDAPDIGSAWSGINYEFLASLNPDVVFLELYVTNESEKELHDEAIAKIESMGIPVVASISPTCLEVPRVEEAWRHIELVGEVFGKQDAAAALVKKMNDRINFIRERTSKIPDSERKNVVVFATENYVMGPKTVQSYYITDIINANNLVEGGDFVTVSEEHLLTYDPDALIVIGHDGYLDPEIIKSGKICGLNWGNLAGIRAIAQDNFICLGYEEWRATMELPAALLKIAALTYPRYFEDIDTEAEEIKIYREDYGFDEDGARKAMEAQRYTGMLEVK
jgi:iron complex transport system substrate-binding protein